MALRPEGHGDLQGDLPDERSIKTHHIYVSFGLRPPICTLYRLYYHHIYVYPFFNNVPGRGSVSSAEERRQCITIVYDDLLWNALVVERASKQYDHVHTFHRSTSSVGLVGLAVSFPSPAQPLNLCMICEETSTTNSPGCVAFFISLFIPASLGSQPLGGGKHPIGWGGYDLGLGEEEFGSG